MASKEAAKLLSEAKDAVESAPAEALETALKAEAAFKEAGDKGGEADAFQVAVAATLAKGDLAKAQRMAGEQLSSAQASGDSSKELGALLTLSEMHLSLGNPEAALGKAKQARRVAEQLGDMRSAAKVALAEALAHTNLGEGEEAEKAAHQAVNGFQKTRDREGEASAWQALSSARDLQGEDAIAPLNKALAIFREQMDRKGEAAALSKLAEAQLATKPQEALQTAKESMSTFRDLGFLPGEARALETIVKAHVAREEAQDAVRVVKDRLALADRLGQVLFTPAAVSAHLSNGELEKAMTAAKDGLENAEDMGDKRLEARMLLKVAEVHLAQEEPDVAVDKAQAALELFEEVGAPVGVATAQSVLTAAYTMNNQAHKAPHRMVGLEHLGKLTESIMTRNKQAFYEAFEKLNSSLGVDQQDFDAVLKPIFKKDPTAEEFFKESSYEFYGLAYEKDVKSHLKKAKNLDRLEMFIGQRFGSMGYGPSFRSVQASWRHGDAYYPGSGSHALSVIQDETKENWEEVAMFSAHPGMMDAALQVQGTPHIR